MSHAPRRTCVGCRTICPASDLVRLIAPDGRVRVARRGRGQAEDEATARGRGSWVHPACIAGAIKSGALVRGFRRRVEISDREALSAAAFFALGRSTDVQGNSR